MERDNEFMGGTIAGIECEGLAFDRILPDGVDAEIRLSTFRPEDKDGAAECHAMIRPTCAGASFGTQLDAVMRALAVVEASLAPRGCRAVIKRYFLSDPANQASLLPSEDACAVSVVGQAPLCGVKVALWVYMVEDADVKLSGNGVCSFARGGYRHMWLGGATAPGVGSLVATRAMLGDWSLALRDNGGTLEANCVRTWFFVRDVDVNYAGVVTGRNEVFAVEGLTRDTHSIASTGIGGSNADVTVTVTMDACAVCGLRTGQMGYLYATSHLNPTYEYGVSFERGTTVDYGDRRQFFISGTASIDNRGEILHPGDIRRQTLRMWENVEALLSEGGADWDDVAQMEVYLRDPSDYAVVNAMFAGRFPMMPYVIVHAPVCRPGWLIEMECMGVCRRGDNRFEPF